MTTPVFPHRAVYRELARIPSCMREDAMQEAHLAHLEGRSAVCAIKNFRRDNYPSPADRYSVDPDVMEDIVDSKYSYRDQDPL